MKKLIFLLFVLLLFSCYKEIERRQWKCTTEIITNSGKCAPDTIRIVAFHLDMTDEEICNLQRLNTYYSYQVEKGDTVAIIESSCNCDPMVCYK
jgi:hypothetical protein